jgi:hypothetical protein
MIGKIIRGAVTKDSFQDPTGDNMIIHHLATPSSFMAFSGWSNGQF